MAGFRKNDAMYVGGIILAVILCFFCADSHSEILTEEEYQGWLKHMSESSDPVSDESLKSLQSSVQQASFYNAASGETQLTGFDAWQAKQQFRKSQLAQQETVVQKDSSSWVIYVAQDGTGDHWTIQDALYSIPQQSSQRVIIFIKAGTY